MDGLRIHPIAYKSPQYSYRSMRLTPNVTQLLGAPTFLRYVLLRRARLQPLLVGSNVAMCADGTRAACSQLDEPREGQSQLVNGIDMAIRSALLRASAPKHDLPPLELDWPHKIPGKEIVVYLREQQQVAAPILTGTIIDLMF